MSRPPTIGDEGLRPYATEAQARYLDAVIEHGSIRGAARALGINYNAVHKGMQALERMAARMGYAPGHWDSGVAPGYRMGKVTVQRTPAGVERVWERQHPQQQAFLEAILGAVSAFGDEPISIPPMAPAADQAVNFDIIPWVNVGDGHIGMLAHEFEVGANFDLKIGERELCQAIAILVDEMGFYDRIVLNDLGDMTHYENFAGKTEAGGHDVDYDSRFPRMIRTYSRVMRFMVDRLLTRCNTLDVIINQGNHSRTNDIWMAELLRVAYGPSNRVNVLDNDSVFIAYRMGKTLVMVHHSDKTKPAGLVQVLAADFSEDWGESTYRYVDVGHIHHATALKEMGDCVVESFNTLAGKTRYDHDHGWRSRQTISLVFRSRTYGDKGRRVLPIEEIRDRIAAAHTEGEQPYRPKKKRAFAV